MKSDKLLDAMEYISDDKILDAKYGKSVKSVPWIKFASIAACAICVIAGSVIGLGGLVSERDADDGNEGTLEDGLPGDNTPTILYNKKLYYWTGIEDIPSSFEEIRRNESVEERPQTADIQIQAEFEAQGIIYANPDYPEVIYVEMTTDGFTDQTVRFATKELGDCERIAYQNRQYRMEYATGTQERIEALPKGCELIGTLHFIGRDAIPQKDLETNVPNDAHSDESMEGREVYMDPEDASVIYVTIYKYSQEGKSIWYQACHLWDE